MIKSGSYFAIVGGNISKVTTDDFVAEIEFENYVKGVNIKDVITVDSYGRIFSYVLGGKGKIKSFALAGDKIQSPQKIPDGSYYAVAGGYEATIDTLSFHAIIKFKQGVRGIGIKDVVTVSGSQIVSNTLGKDGELVSFVQH